MPLLQSLSPSLQEQVSIVDGYGNVGDRLIYEATRQLLDAFDVRWKTVEPEDVDGDVALLFGGGNLGSIYTGEVEKRQQATKICAERGIPSIVLPQSAMGPEEETWDQLWLRETESRKFFPNARLAPDLALGFDFSISETPTEDHGVWLRTDVERWGDRSDLVSRGDPAPECATPAAYLRLAARYRRISTDRLHFAICGLICGREVTLYPNSYHKNRSMWETWLKDLGCRWKE